MLGSSTTQQWYASADSIQIKPKIICEWNSNAFANPYIYGQGDGTCFEITTMSNSTGLTITNDGSLGATSKKFSIEFPYTTGFIAKEHVMTVNTLSPVGKAYRLSFLAKSISEVFDIAVIATAKDSSGNIIEQTTSNFTLNPSRNSPFIVDCFSYDISRTISTMEYTISAINNYYNPNTTIIIDSPRMYVIEQSEMFIKQYSSVSEVFKINRPGDPYIQADIGNGNVSPYYLAYNGFINAINSSWKKARNFLASYDAAFKYYFYEFTSTSNTGTIFCKYLNKAICNKIVLKVNSIKNIPSSLTISTLNSSGSWSSPVSITSPFDANGLSKIYWNGSTWTKTEWVSIPTYSDQTISLSTDIYGIRIVFTSTASQTTTDNEVHLVEISPRLELDISSYVKSFSVTSELSDDSLPTPMGRSNSNTANIELENLPNQNTKIQPFDNYTSPLAGLLGKNVNVRIIVKPFGQDSSQSETQIASMISASWTNNQIDSSSIELYDKLKTLSTIPAASFYQRGANPAEIISSLLDSVGFTDYNYEDLKTLGQSYTNNSIPYYWTVSAKNISTLQAIQNILLPYQISMYVDAYGIIRFKHIAEIIKSNPLSFYAITDKDYGSIKSNILEFSINDENTPSKISVEHSVIGPMEYTSIYNGVRSSENLQVADIPQKLIGFIKLAQTLEPSHRSLKYKFESIKSFIDSFTGYLLIGSEIIQYDGIEYFFKVVKNDMSTAINSHVVKSESEVEYWKSFYALQDNVIFVGESLSDGQIITLCNLTRGCFGSGVKRHSVGTDVSKFSTNGTISSTGYGLQVNKSASKTYATYLDATCTSKHRVFSGSFTIPNNVSIPSNGSLAEFGLCLGASTVNSSNDAVEVGITIYQKSKNSEVINYKIGVAIRQYNSSGTAIFEKMYDVGEFQASANEDTISNRKLNEVFINRFGNNTLVVMFNQDNLNATNTGENINNLSVIINGNIIKFDNETNVIVNNIDKSSLKKFDLPSIKIKNSPSFSNKKISVYSNGVIPIEINSLQAFEIQSDSSNVSIRNNLTLLSSVMNGNLLGLSNKDELESVVRRQKIIPSYNEIGYVSESVGREIKVFDIDYTAKNTFPVLFAFILRNPYIEKTVNPVSNKTTTVYVPAESITVSSIDNSPTQARFAMINSYTEPVYINVPPNATLFGGGSTTMLGSVLKIVSKKTLSTSINEDNSESEISLKSDWIQSEQAASKVLGNIVSSAIMKRNSIDVKVFGNPLIEIGDVIEVQYTLKNFNLTKYVVVSVEQTYSNGLETSVILRRIQK